MNRDEAIQTAATFLHETTGDLLDDFAFRTVVDEITDALVALAPCPHTSAGASKA